MEIKAKTIPVIIIGCGITAYKMRERITVTTGANDIMGTTIIAFPYRIA
jgi:hypothetical protein